MANRTSAGEQAATNLAACLQIPVTNIHPVHVADSSYKLLHHAQPGPARNWHGQLVQHLHHESGWGKHCVRMHAHSTTLDNRSMQLLENHAVYIYTASPPWMVDTGLGPRALALQLRTFGKSHDPTRPDPVSPGKSPSAPC